MERDKKEDLGNWESMPCRQPLETRCAPASFQNAEVFCQAPGHEQGKTFCRRVCPGPCISLSQLLKELTYSIDPKFKNPYGSFLRPKHLAFQIDESQITRILDSFGATLLMCSFFFLRLESFHSAPCRRRRSHGASDDRSFDL